VERSPHIQPFDGRRSRRMLLAGGLRRATRDDSGAESHKPICASSPLAYPTAVVAVAVHSPKHDRRRCYLLGRARERAGISRCGWEAVLTTIDRLRERIIAQGIDALIALSPENVAYTIGFMVPSHPVNRHRRTISVVTADGNALLIVVSVEAPLARERSAVTNVCAYDQFNQAPMQVLADCLIEFGLQGARIGLELDYIPAKDYLELTAILPKAKFVPNRDLYLAARMVKDEVEIERLRRIARISDEAQAIAFEHVRVGMSERQLAAIVTEAVLSGGADAVRMNIGSGERSGIVNPKPTDRAISRGDVIRLEILGTLENYQSNITRTGVVGEPTSEQVRIWRVLMEARKRALECLVSNTPASVLWTAYADHCRSNGIEPTLAFLGHGIGLTGHEEPYLTANTEIIVTPGIVLTYEPFYMVPGKMGFHVEDMFLVTESGYEALNTVTQNDSLVRLG
jgi:Xaa-Pro dipeptidase